MLSLCWQLTFVDLEILNTVILRFLVDSNLKGRRHLNFRTSRLQMFGLQMTRIVVTGKNRIRSNARWYANTIEDYDYYYRNFLRFSRRFSPIFRRFVISYFCITINSHFSGNFSGTTKTVDGFALSSTFLSTRLPRNTDRGRCTAGTAAGVWSSITYGKRLV